MIHLDPSKKHDFIWVFDVKNANPNGDPDSGNMPRIDIQTNHGIVTDACLKRKIRNFVELTTDERIFIQEGSILNDKINEGVLGSGHDGKKRLTDPIDVAKARAWMCQNFYDIRVFGGVLSTGNNAGQVRGPVQITFAESIDQIIAMNISITRCAATEVRENKDNKTMGRKTYIPYGLYVAYGFFSPAFAEQTGVTSDDLNLLWGAIYNCFELDRSANKGLMVTQKLFIFSHEQPLGNYPTHKLFDLLSIAKKPDIDYPRKFSDYSLNLAPVPEEISLTEFDMGN
jgi:CRISPR-associated protein Csd2